MSNAPAAPQMVRRDDRTARGPGRVVIWEIKGGGGAGRGAVGRKSATTRGGTRRARNLGATRRQGRGYPGTVVVMCFTTLCGSASHTCNTEHTLKSTSNSQLTHLPGAVARPFSAETGQRLCRRPRAASVGRDRRLPPPHAYVTARRAASSPPGTCPPRASCPSF
ncbi:hypothetical protein EVAR_98664_1 [Eumeta japonica]|uniref:Uncharacterized protein n=1 Tax=Eumeta variegata TaxID=151549 RepID=A0A4C1XWS8_EUMVA|nr:hypothetical protein EVAR_98664_1 [Eumeta japonica]